MFEPPFFQIKEELRDSRKLFDVLVEYLGNPIESSLSASLWNSAHTYTYSWKLFNYWGHALFTLTYIDGSDSLDLNYQINMNEPPLLAQSQDTDFFKTNIQDLINLIRKPWSSYPEEELIKKPIFIYHYFLEKGTVSDNLHQAMVMKSYSDPEDKYIKKYFNDLKEKIK